VTDVAFRACATDELGSSTVAQILDLCHACWPDGDFTQDDLEHALGGRHFLAESAGRVVSHVAVVARGLELDGLPVRAGYVEAVATLPPFRRRGLARRLMAAANAHIVAASQLGALSTGEPAIYERLGWRRWMGETWVREPDGTLTRTPDDDDGIMVLETPRTRPLNVAGRLTCDWRTGDVW
jgi:aminoglycoside 2'-N-acetyltransferase I